MEDHIKALNDHNVDIDEVVIASDIISKEIMQLYLDDNRTIVKVKNSDHEYKIVEADLLSFDRLLIRHDPLKIKNCIEKLLKEV